jgi:uncharacterized protein
MRLTDTDGLVSMRSDAKPKATGYLFLPPRLRRARFLVWLRRTHAWLGFWGAALALLFGASGILLNHRAIMKIPAAKMEQTVVQLALPVPRPGDAQALSHWLQGALGTAKPPSLVKVEPAQRVVWNGTKSRSRSRGACSLQRHSAYSLSNTGSAMLS